MWCGAITIFPDLISTFAKYGMLSQAIDKSLLQLQAINLRDFTEDKYKSVDDRPFGGGPGMVLTPKPLSQAIEYGISLAPETPKVVYASPQGKRVNQKHINDAANTQQPLLFIAGRYEGIDERIIQHYVDEEWCLSDFVLAGGELAVLSFIEGIARLLPGLMNHESAKQDSFMDGLLDCPHYTRPREFLGIKVPDVLLSGNHDKIRAWRMQQKLMATLAKKPHLLEKLQLSQEQQHFISNFLGKERKSND